eukprot:GHUV01028020.1.p1 GENE.GHUV01028020.1~~GHUV01028020.1.p1  ORF type:complete len:109 (+),score=26.88 GHUV01028020.1:330-656(+)
MAEPEQELLTIQAASRPRKKKQKQDAYLQQVGDKKLKGQLKHTELLYREANKTAARVNQWLAPADAGFTETQGGSLLQLHFRKKDSLKDASSNGRWSLTSRGILKYLP